VIALNWPELVTQLETPASVELTNGDTVQGWWRMPWSLLAVNFVQQIRPPGYAPTTSLSCGRRQRSARPGPGDLATALASQPVSFRWCEYRAVPSPAVTYLHRHDFPMAVR
jgi:hypothetical protein